LRSFDRRAERAERRKSHIADLRKRAAGADARLKRLYDAIGNGSADLSDPLLEDRVSELKAAFGAPSSVAKRRRAGDSKH
jgi:site-specific DNA recombinase